MRYRIEVRAKRGDQPSYHCVEYPSVKPGQAQRLVDKTAMDLATRERVVHGAELMGRFEWHETSDEDIVPVSLYVGDAEFHVMATPIL